MPQFAPLLHSATAQADIDTILYCAFNGRCIVECNTHELDFEAYTLRHVLSTRPGKVGVGRYVLTIFYDVVLAIQLQFLYYGVQSWILPSRTP